MIIAIPSAPGVLREQVVRACRERDIPVRTLPGVFELISGSVNLMRQVREVQVEDVLGREPVRVEIEQVGAYLRDRIVLVTGAGGSIGSELCRQIARVRPRLLVLLDHAEDNLFEIERELIEERHFTACESILADCKEPERMREVMRALPARRRLPRRRLQARLADGGQPARGRAQQRDRHARSCAAAAAAVGRERSCWSRPTRRSTRRPRWARRRRWRSGSSRRSASRYADTVFCCVRFGNVLGSSGSVVPLFRRQIEQGGPVTVTDPDMARYFMTIPEAVQLIIRAGNLARGGEVFVLEMGEQVKIIDLARNMIRLSGQEPDEDIPIEIVGPRPGEKLREELFNAGRAAGADRRGPDPEGRACRRSTRIGSRACSSGSSGWWSEGDEAFLTERIAELMSSRAPCPSRLDPNRRLTYGRTRRRLLWVRRLCGTLDPCASLFLPGSRCPAPT